MPRVETGKKIIKFDLIKRMRAKKKTTSKNNSSEPR
jgi:hypothetical protein